MKNEPRFKIGDWVKALGEAVFYYDDQNNRQVESLKFKNPILGQIVGARVKFLGKFHEGSGHGTEYGWKPPYLEAKGSVIVWLVREGYLNQEVEVLDSDLKLYEGIHDECIQIKSSTPRSILPWRKVKNTWDDRAKNELRQIMKDHPRDSKGRWVKA